MAVAAEDETDPRRILGLRIATYRRYRRLDQGDVANACRVSRPLVSKWENGHAVPDALELIPLCRVLGVKVEELLAPGGGELTLSAESQQAPVLTAIEGGRTRSADRQRTFGVFRSVHLVES